MEQPSCGKIYLALSSLTSCCLRSAFSGACEISSENAERGGIKPAMCARPSGQDGVMQSTLRAATAICRSLQTPVDHSNFRGPGYTQPWYSVSRQAMPETARDTSTKVHMIYMRMTLSTDQERQPRDLDALLPDVTGQKMLESYSSDRLGWSARTTRARWSPGQACSLAGERYSQAHAAGILC